MNVRVTARACALAAAVVTAACLTLSPAVADNHAAPHADAHGPIGVMGDHAHKKGEFMASYRFMRMEMSGAGIGTDSVTPEEVVGAVANVNAPPANLRVVPTDMTMDMHMFGLMWAPSDRVTLMAMAPYLVKDMDHVTFQGMMGTTRLGTFNARSEGFGDVKLSALVRLRDGDGTRLVANIGMSLPTGSIDESGAVLTPMNTTPTLTLPYAMQLGSGTVDPFASLTWAGSAGNVGWGAQGSALVRLYDNDQDYRLGDEFRATAWGSYAFAPAVSGSLRLSASSLSAIDGRDVRIGAPVQTANPDFYGGERIELGVGLNFVGRSGAVRGQRLALEISTPIYEDLNGPQMETDLTVTLGWQYAWGGR